MTHGRFQTADGVPLGTNEFYIPSGAAYNQTARVEYGDGMFLVTWLDLRNDPTGNIAWVYGRLLRFGPGGTPTFVGPDFLIGAAVGGVHRQSGRCGGLLHCQQAVSGRLSSVRRRRAARQRHPRSAGVGHRAAGRRSDQRLVRQPLPGRGRRRLQPVERQVPRRLPQLLRTGGAGDDPDADGQRRRRRARHARPTSPAAQHERPRSHLQHQEQPVSPGLVADHRGAGNLLRAPREPGRRSRCGAVPDDRQLRRLRFARRRLQRASRHVLRRRPRPRARRVPAGGRRRRNLGRRRAERRVRSHGHGQQARQLQSAHRRQHGAQRVDDGDVHGLRDRQRAAHQDARQRRRAAAAPAATAAADRSVGRRRAQRQLVPRRRRGERHGEPGSTPSISSPTRTTSPSTRASGSPATTAR